MNTLDCPHPILPEHPFVLLLLGAGTLSLILLSYLLWWWDAPLPWKSRWCPYLHPSQVCPTCAAHHVPPPPPLVTDMELVISAPVAAGLMVGLLATMAVAPLLGGFVAVVLGLGVLTTGKDLRVCMVRTTCPGEGPVYACPLEVEGVNGDVVWKQL